MVAATREQLPLHLTAERSAPCFVAFFRRLCAGDHRVRLLQPIGGVEGVCQARCSEREVPRVAQLLLQPETLCSELGGCIGIPGQQLDPDGLEGREVRKQEVVAALCVLRAQVGDDRACLVELPESCERPGPIGAEELIAAVLRLNLVEPGEQLGDRGGSDEKEVRPISRMHRTAGNQRARRV